MTEDPFVREIGRLTDDVGRVLIVGVDYDAVTLRTLHLQDRYAVALAMGQQEELGQLLIAAVWQAGWQRMKMDADTGLAAAPGRPAGTDRKECGCGPDDMCAICAPSDEALAQAIMAALSAEIRDQDAGAP